MSGVVILNPSIPISLADSNAITAFGRLAVSEAQTIFSSQQQYGDDATVWENAFVGTGAVSFLANESTIQMTTGGTGSTASAIRQSRLFFRYTPGHGQTIFTTFCMDGGATVTNNTRRIGYFDASNGIFLEVSGAVVRLVRRTNVSGSPTDNQVAQASWNIDKFNGTGPSGVTIDWTKTQIMVIDLQWLGVGRVRVGFDVNGIFYPAHAFNNANVLTTVYMTTANLPIRLENFNVGGTASGTATLRHICTAITTGGGAEPNSGRIYSAVSNTTTGLALTSTTLRPIMSLRAATTGPNSVRNTGQINLQEYSVFVANNSPVSWQLLLNPTLTGASFSSYGAISDIDTSATSYSGGTVIDGGYLQGSASAKGSTQQYAPSRELVLGYSGLLNHQDVLTLVVNAAAGNTNAVAAFQWLETV